LQNGIFVKTSKKFFVKWHLQKLAKKFLQNGILC